MSRKAEATADERDPAVVRSQQVMLRENAVDTLKEIRASLKRTTDVLEAKNIRAKVEAVRRYAMEAGNRDLELLAAQGRLEAERRAGEILIETIEHAGGRPSDKRFHNGTVSSPTLADLGIDKKQSSLWQGLARLPEERFDRLLKEISNVVGSFSTAKVLQMATGKTKHAVHFSSISTEWLTPPEIIEATLAVLDEIDLDPCAEILVPGAGSNWNVPAKHHFTKHEDGLVVPWEGRVFMNPPYGDIVEAWVDSVVGYFTDGPVSEAIILTASRTDRSWFRKLAEALVCFVDHRLNFLGGAHNAPFPSAVFYLGDRRDRFVEIFSKLGPVYGVY